MALRKRTDAYWQKRAEQRLTQSERATKKNMRELRKVYANARKRTVEQIQKIYAAYYKDEGFDMQALRSIVPRGELKRFLDEMKKLGLKTSLPDNYNARVTRLRLINEQLAAEAHKVATEEQKIDTDSLKTTYTDAYYQSGFDVARGIGSTPVGFGALDTQTIDQVLNAKFEGRNFSSRVWTNSDILATKLKNTLAVAIANGQSVYKTASEVRNDFGVGQYYAERLIRTESNHFHNEGELEAYKAMGFEYFQFLATLDNRTSEICAEMDGKKFKVSEGIPGDNVPPLHPNCRSTIVPYFKGYEPETRLYRDPETGRNGYTYKVDYNGWKQSLPPVKREMFKTRPTESTPANNGRYKVIAERVSKGYVGNRRHLLAKIAELRNVKNAVAAKFADIYSGAESTEVFFGYPQKETAKLYGANGRTKIYLTRNYALHMDNSGHITGTGYGINAHNDKRPLSVSQMVNIPNIIKTAKPSEVRSAGVVRGANRYSVTRKTSSNQIVVIEVSSIKGRIDIVTAYNLTDKQFERIRKK